MDYHRKYMVLFFMLKRLRHRQALRGLLKQYPVTAILGPRQVGKTTLALSLGKAGQPLTRFDLENPRDLNRLEDPLGALAPLKGLIVIDEIQRRPELFPVLRVLADRRPRRASFLILGSASPALLKQSSESLAGRIAYHRLDGFDLQETGAAKLMPLWLRGGFPRSFLARNEGESLRWRQDFLANFLERDVPQLGLRVPAATLRRFWGMLSHYHGQTWNSSELARSFGVSDTTIRHYLDILSDTFMVRQLRAWHENLEKRQVKAPKVYLADTGLLHHWLGIRDAADLEMHPKCGASWEGFAMQQVVARLGVDWNECHFWATQNNAELDLLVVRGRLRLGFEFKKTSSPSVTPSMRIAMHDLRLASLDVLYPGHETYPLAKGIRAVGLSNIDADLKPL